MDDLISVLLPIYNSQKVLAECLDSILAQTYPYFEVVAVDDGSTDNTPAILAAYAKRDSKIRVVSLGKNRGIVDALNIGLEQCRGRWIARMDADDMMTPERLSVQLTYMFDHPEVDLLGAQVKIFREDRALTAGQRRYQDWSNSLISDQAIKQEIFAESPIMHPTFFLTKRFCNEMGGYQSNPWAEDYDFILRAYLKNATFAKLPQIVVEKRDSPTRLARTDARCKRKAMFNAKAHYFAISGLPSETGKIFIAGTGSSGRKAYAALKREKVPIHGFVDNIESDTKRTVAGLPVTTLNAETAEHFFVENRDCFLILCIGVPKGLAIINMLLIKHNLHPGKDYIRFI